MHVEVDERRWQGWPGASRGVARAFGEHADDLEVNFARTQRAEIVNALLRHCLRDDAGAWDGDTSSWTLAQRLQALLAVADASGISTLTVVQGCDTCGELLQLDVDTRMFVREERLAEFEWSAESGERLRVALPTGADQRRWAQADADLSSMARQLVRAIDGKAPPSAWEIPAAWIDGLAQALEQNDPLTALELQTQCPHCGTLARIAFDLEAELVAQLRARQQRTLAHIHRLASAYHWSEAAILELPAWRRRYYLAQLDAGVPA